MKTGKGLSSSALAAELGISRQRVNELGRKGKIQRNPDGTWDLAKVRADLGHSIDGSQKSPARDGMAAEAPEAPVVEPPKGTLLYEQWRLTREKADREAVDRQAIEGKLLKREEVKSAWSGMIAAVTNRLESIPDELCDRLASTVDAIECREILADKIREARMQLSEYPANA
jgi:phage terminase Nu1 subunit (DNA packaging protein)